MTENYINDDKLSLNKYSYGYQCLNYSGAISHRYAIRRKSPVGAYWWHGFNQSHEMVNFITKHVDDGNETHEIIGNCSEEIRHLLFFDIDADAELFKNIKLTFDMLLELLDIKVRLTVAMGTLQPKILKCNRQGKYSAHIIYPVLISSAHAKCVPMHVAAGMRKLLIEMGYDDKLADCIDMGVYRSISSMRVMGSPKFSDGVKLPGFTINDDSSIFNPSTLITVFDEKTTHVTCETSYCNVKALGKTKKHQINVDINSIQSICDKITNMFQQYQIIGQSGNIIKIKDDHTANCIICKRRHVNENPYAIINSDGSVSLVCRRNEKSRLTIVEAPEKKTTPDKHDRRTPKRILIDQMIFALKLKKLLSKTNKTTDSQFMEQLQPVMRNCKHLALSSPLGSGKTKALFDFIETYGKYGIIVSIIHRKSLTSNMRPRYKKAGFVIYDEIEGEIDVKKHKRILIQYESLHRLNLMGVRLDLLICDEVNSVCMQYLSKIATVNRGISECLLEAMFRSARSSILMDGNLCDRIVNAVNCLGQREYYVWENNAINKLAPNILLTEYNAAFTAELIKKLKERVKCELVTSRGPNYCETMAKILSEAIPGIKLLTLHSETENLSSYTSNVEEEWVKYDCIIRSPAIGAGIDFTALHFDYCFVDVRSGGPIADDILQAMRRSRHIKSNTYVVHFGKCAVTEYPTTYEGVLKQAEGAISHNLSDSIRPDFDGVIQDGRFKFRDLENPLLKFDVWCRTYNNKQRNNTVKRMMEAFIRMGAKFSFIDDVSKEEKTLLDKQSADVSEELKSVNFKEIAAAEDITNEVFVDLIAKQRMSKQQRSIVNKYVLRASYKYAGEMSEEWVKKYSDKKVLLMNKHISSRDTPINELAAVSDDMIENMTDVERLTKRKTSFMYNVARTKIRDMYDKHNKTIDLPVKLMEYVNNEIKINNPIYGSKKLKAPNTKFVLAAVNDVLNVVGYEIRIKCIYKTTPSSKKIYEFEWFDIAPNYYNLLETIEKYPLKPYFPKTKPTDQCKYAELL